MRLKQKNELLARLLSALVLVPIVLLIVYAGGIYFQVLILFTCILMSLEWSRLVRSSNDTLMSKITWDVFGFFYCTLPCLSLLFIRDLPNGFEVMLWLILSVWATDTGAYFVGVNLRGPKILPSISPKKTWSGLVGGIISSALVGYIFHTNNPTYHINYFYIGFLIAVVSQFGDFLESAVKRNFNVKDSGNLIPGHGGILDRVDGVVTTAIFIAILEVLSLQ